MDEIEPVRFEPPYVFRWRFREARPADELKAAHPWARRLDPLTLEFRTDDFLRLPL